MNQRADLHIHTTASDGTLTPEQVVREAARIGLGAVGIADHDTVGGIETGLAAARETGIIFVPAVEINTDYGKDEVHVLGYFVDHQSPSLNAHLQRQRNARLERGKRMVERLNELGVNISFERVQEIAGGGAIGRPHIARAIVEAGYASLLNEAFGKFLIRGAPAYVARHKLTPFQAIEMVLEAGGVAVLAHPGIHKHDELIAKLIEAGMRGIEAYHTEHSSVQAAHYVEVARRYNLIVTGGSDSHGPNNLKTVAIEMRPICHKTDNRILAVAYSLSKALVGRVFLVSKDLNLRVKSDVLGIPAQDFYND